MGVRKRVADVVIEALAEAGITDCFAVVGGGAMHLDNALAIHSSIHTTFNHHEQACAMAAEAYARSSGRIAAICVTSGPGASNAITGVVGAWQDSIPLIVLSGQVRYATMARASGLPLRYRGVQELDIIPMVSSITKYAIMLLDPLAARREVRKAIDIAMTGRRGPVWIDIPLDVQSTYIESEDLYPLEPISPVPSLSENEALEIINELSNAKRPCILSGTGIVSSANKDRFLDFVHRMNVPVLAGGWCADILGTEEELYFGLSGDIGPRTGNFILQTADVILVLGNSLSFRQTGFSQDKFAPNAKILYVDVDEAESKKPGLRIARFYHSDLSNFFDAMKGYICTGASESWLSYCQLLRKRFTVFESIDKGVDPEARVNSYYFWKVVDGLLNDDEILALGNSRVDTAKLQIGASTNQQRTIANYLCGSMGYDLPAAIGTAVATNKRVICVTGDGSIMMNLQELQTIAHNHLPIKVVIFSNDGYEAIRQTHKNFFNGLLFGCDLASGISFPDFSHIAEAFGFKYLKCSSNKEVESRFKDFLEVEEPVILEVLQQIDNPVTPKLMSRMNPDGTFSTPSLQDMAPFITQDELESLMKQGLEA